MNRPRIFADFHNADPQGRLRLNCVGSIEDLAKQKVELFAGLGLTLYSEDLETDGNVEYSEQEKLWVAAIDWNAVHSSDAADGVPEVLNR